MAVVNKDLMRAINRFAILHAIRDAGTISRVDISRNTGLSQSTVTGITAELIREGMLLEQESDKSAGGRRPVPLSLNPAGAYTVGVHLSVDQITVVLMDLQAAILHAHTAPLQTDNFEIKQVLDTLVLAVQNCLWEAEFSKKQISGIGIAIPGLIDSRTGYVRYIPNYKWKNIELADLVAERIGIRTFVENSANTLVIFEQWFGIGRGVDNFVLVTTEHGIGMGMVVNGKLFRGFRGVAGEFGHTIIAEDGPVCRCGERGCLEAICGNNAILRDAKQLIEDGKWRRTASEPLTIDEVLAEAQQGNQPLVDIYREVGRKLGIGLSNLYKIFDPEKIIISGKGTLAGELLFEPMRQTLHPDISLGNDSPTTIHIQKWQPTNYARGAGALVLQEIYESPANRVVPLI